MRRSAGNRILMLLENNSYPQDVRVRRETQSLMAAGYEVAVISPSPEGSFRLGTIDGVRIYQYPSLSQYQGFLGYVLEFGWAMIATLALTVIAALRHGFDVIHAHNPPDSFVLIAAPFKLAGKRFVFDHHDLSPEMYDAKFGQRSVALVQSFLLGLERLTFRFSDHVLSTNESYRNIAIGRGSVPPERVTIVRNAPDVDRVRPVAPDPGLRERAGIIIGYVGTMGHQDGVDYLLRALSHLVQDLGRKDMLTVIVGGGDAVPGLKALATDMQLDDHVWFTGRISDGDLMRYLSTADICVDPDPSNPFNDRSSMIKLTEYMALGKPIVAFDLPEHRVTCQDAAIYAAPNDTLDFARRLAELMDDPHRRQRIGACGKRRVEGPLAWVHQEANLLRAYAQIAETSS